MQAIKQSGLIFWGVRVGLNKYVTGCSIKKTDRKKRTKFNAPRFCNQES